MTEPLRSGAMDPGIGGRAQVDRAVRDARQRGQAVLERLGVLLDEKRGVDGKRVGVDCRDKKRVRVGVRHRNTAERPRAQRRPQAGGDEIGARLLLIERSQLGCGPGLERLGVVALQPDDHRLQRASRAPVYRDDFACTRRRERHFRVALVVVQHLPEADLVALLYRHSRADTRHVGCDGRNRLDLCAVADRLFGFSLDRDIQAFPDFYTHVAVGRLIKLCAAHAEK